MKKVSGILLSTLLLTAVCFIATIPSINDSAAGKVSEAIKNLPLPENTEYIESFSTVGKLVGNGNGMQYLGGILVRSALSQTALQNYYAQYAPAGSAYAVEVQNNGKIAAAEHGNLYLQTDLSGDNLSGDNYYIVYSWGKSGPFWSSLDIRAH